MILRPDLFFLELPNGQFELYDPLTQQAHFFSPEEGAALLPLRPRGPSVEHLDPELLQKLGMLGLLEDEDTQSSRTALRQSQVRVVPPPAGLDATQPMDWSIATTLPDWVDPFWRNGEQWRRLAEDVAGGRQVLRIPGFVSGHVAMKLRERVGALPFKAGSPPLSTGAWLNLGPDDLALSGDDLPDILGAFRHGVVRQLLAAVVGITLPDEITVRAWKLEPGDGISVHADGAWYMATFSIGLNPAWRAENGGAIAFGVPTDGGLDVTARWWPHLGDLLLFRTTSVAWHAVEPVTQGTRLTLTGFYTQRPTGL